MKSTNILHIRKCPRCGKSYAAPPALSRTDNETLICPDCGTREALASIGIKADEHFDTKLAFLLFARKALFYRFFGIFIVFHNSINPSRGRFVAASLRFSREMN